jgi:hypothetical protein
MKAATVDTGQPRPRSRGRRLLAAALALLLAACASDDSTTHWAMLDAYCIDCHNAAEFTAGLSFESLDPNGVGDEAEVWERVVRKLRGRMMPPPGERRPEAPAIDAFVAWLETRLDAAEPEPDPGHTILHRLNRRQYANAVADLIAVTVDPVDLLPVDDTEGGFDNVANALQVSPSFIDQYLSAAQTLAARAIGQVAARPGSVTYNIPPEGQEFYVEGLPLGTRGGAVIEHYFPSDGEYRLSIGDMMTGRYGFNQEHVNTVVATLDGAKLFEHDVGGGDDLKAMDQGGQNAMQAVNARLKNIPFAATAGVHRLGVTFRQRSLAESDHYLRALVPGSGQGSMLRIETIDVLGPIDPTGLSDTASRNAVFSCYPADASEERDCATQIVSQLSARAFRGLVADDDIDRLMQLYEQGAANGGFEKGVEYALSGVLVHPKFLYRIEEPPADLNAGATYVLGDVELASRLSFFLWGSLPDEALLEVAATSSLSQPDRFEQQVRRMLADPRSRWLASSFAYQWLGLTDLDAIDPDPVLFTDVSGDLRQYLERETELFVDSIFRADRPVLDLLTADHTYLNETLARHYGINDIRGQRMRRVQLTDPRRWGLFGKGATLMVSSYPNRTSPVLRGAWVLETILGTPPAEPPPDVEALPELVVGQVASTVRERLEIHRSNPSCNGCHGLIDPLGFSLENFDAVGRWRDRDRLAATPIDASGVLVDGTPIEGPVNLRDAILERPEQFVQTFVEKLMTFGLGRSLTYRDMPTVRDIVRQATDDDYRFSTIVLGIARSPQFRRARPPAVESATASVEIGAAE